MHRLSTRLFIALTIMLLLTLQVAYAERDREIMRLGRGAATSLAWRPDGKVLAVGSSTGVWFFDDQLNQINYIESEAAQSVKWSPDSKNLLIVKDSNAAEIWSINNAFSISKRFMIATEGQSFIWSPNSKWIAISNGYFQNDQFKGSLQIINALTGNSISSLTSISYPPYPSWSPDSLSLVIQTDEKTLQILDVQTGETLSTYHVSHTDDQISAFAFETAKKQIQIFNTWDSNLYTWNVATNQTTNKSISDYNDCLANSMRVSNSDIAFICYGLSGGYDTLNILPNATLPILETGLQDSILSYDWQPNTTSITVLYKKGILQTWDTQTNITESHQLFILPNAVIWSPDSQYVALSSGNYGEDWAYPVAVWSINNQQPIASTPQPASIFYPLSSTKWVSWKDTSTLLVYSDSQTIPNALCFLYSLESWSVVNLKKSKFGFENDVCGLDGLPANWKYIVEWSKDFKWVAYTEGDNIKIAPNTPNNETRITLQSSLSAESISWSPDDHYLIVRGTNKKTNESNIELWEVQSGKLLITLKLKQDDRQFSYSRDPIWSPDSTKFAITNEAHNTSAEMSIFSAGGELLFKHETNSLSTILSWSPDSQKLAVAVGEVSAKHIEIIDPLTGKNWFAYDSNSTDLVWSLNSQYLIYALVYNDSLNLVDVKNGKELMSFSPGRFNTISLSPDGTMLALGMEDGTIRIWDVADLMTN